MGLRLVLNRRSCDEAPGLMAGGGAIRLKRVGDSRWLEGSVDGSPNSINSGVGVSSLVVLIILSITLVISCLLLCCYSVDIIGRSGLYAVLIRGWSVLLLKEGVRVMMGRLETSVLP